MPRLSPLVAVVATAVATLSLPAAGATASAPSPGEGGRLLVRFAPGAERAVAHRAAGAHAVTHLARVGIDVVEVGAGGLAPALAAYRARPDVARAEPDGVLHAATNDPIYPYQWNLQPTSAQNQGTANWEPVAPLYDGSGVKVAVIDSGFARGGEDEPLHLEMGRDFVDGDDDPHDENGHGTHITGTVAQATDNTKGVAGVAPGATVLVVRALDDEGNGTVSHVIQGIDYALGEGADVLNLSLAGNFFSGTLCDAVSQAAVEAVVVAAVGNDGGAVAYPARCPGVIGVGALTYDGALAPYSNRGPELDLAAPGGMTQGEDCSTSKAIVQEMFFEDDFEYVCRQGTSMAAAHVAGAAALVLQVNPFANVEEALERATRDLGPPGPDDVFGAGALDVAGAVGLAPSLSGRAYWMVAADGGIFSFGDARFYGSTGNLRLAQPVVSMTSAANAKGYWLIARDGGVFTFKVPFLGSIPSLGMTATANNVRVRALPDGSGYYVLATNGSVYTFGYARYHGAAPTGLAVDLMLVPG